LGAPERSGPTALPRAGAGRWHDLVGGLSLAILDLLEDLAHAWPHEGALLGGSLAIAPTKALALAWIERIVVGHR
jgi:hypothetical protein